MSIETCLPWRAWADYGCSREKICFSSRDTSEFLGTVDAWTGSKYWPVRTASGQLVAHVRAEIGGLYAPYADKAQSMQLAGRILFERRPDSGKATPPTGDSRE